jgi:2-polyprenyl-3-methyl-5-hydroxy-6-metoxy-1,4-benzoquinol methylase
MACFGVKDAEVIDARAGLAEVRPASVDVILALDVLEHVDDVRAVAARFREMMSPTGRLLCSLPTENALYRLGRRLAGFSGAYHLREPRAVVRDLTTVFRVKRVARLYPFLPFFDFYEAAT